MVKAAFNEKKTLFCKQIGLNLKKENNEVLHFEHNFVCC